MTSKNILSKSIIPDVENINNLICAILVHIFEKFSRLDEARLSDTGGAGLGLSIAKEIISLHGGEITAQSNGETVTFTITLPVSD